MMYLNSHHQLIVDKEDRFIQEQDRQDQVAKQHTKRKLKFLKNLEAKIQEIQSDTRLTEFDKLEKLKKLKNESQKPIKALFPKSHMTVCKKVFDTVIAEQTSFPNKLKLLLQLKIHTKP
ncbi:hypothetical protein QUW45_06760 [Limosilactobacillus pontis]|uniref:hypothetical protein n=1 Tax=Limosilactobacillus pontis TaxID=35787 RepID=UPI0025A311E3|nr:hypothetical protein [Limosilactobacillus pontis]MDM8332376.1 hypothetical protein [Limosilactobacillus pontis]